VLSVSWSKLQVGQEGIQPSECQVGAWMTPAYSGIGREDRVVEDAVSKPDNDTDDTMQVIKKDQGD